MVEKPKQITFCWDNLTITAKGSNARKGLCGTRMFQKDHVPDKHILKSGKLNGILHIYLFFISLKKETKNKHLKNMAYLDEIINSRFIIINF